VYRVLRYGTGAIMIMMKFMQIRDEIQHGSVRFNFEGLWLYDIPHFYRPINFQNTLTLLLYFMQDYDCISLGTV